MHTTISFQGKTIEFDEHGYLTDINKWSEDLAVYLSERDSLELKTDHNEYRTSNVEYRSVIYFIKEFRKDSYCSGTYIPSQFHTPRFSSCP